MIKAASGSDVNTLREFVIIIAEAASLPRSRLDGLDFTVLGDAQELPGHDERRYRFTASFTHRCRSHDNKFQQLYTYSIVGNYDGTFNRAQTIVDNLGVIKQRLSESYGHLETSVDENKLNIVSAFYTLTNSR